MVFLADATSDVEQISLSSRNGFLVEMSNRSDLNRRIGFSSDIADVEQMSCTSRDVLLRFFL